MQNLHDPNGPDVQSHWEGEDLIITISDKLSDELGWKKGDTVVFAVDEHNPQQFSISKKS